MSELITARIRAFAEGLLPAMGLELVDVQFRREGHGWVLRLFIDGEEGVTLKHCSMVSREISAYLDVEELIEQSYHLEVSSPGLERPLLTFLDFKRFCGKNVRVKLRESVKGQRVFIGKINQVHEDQTIELIMGNGDPLIFSYSAVNKARLSI